MRGRAHHLNLENELHGYKPRPIKAVPPPVDGCLRVLRRLDRLIGTADNPKAFANRTASIAGRKRIIMASYAELQPMPPRWPTPLRIELPDAELREIATQHGCSWIGGLLRVTAECGHPMAGELLSRVAALPHRVVVDFCITASTPGDPPTQIIRWVGENDIWPLR